MPYGYFSEVVASHDLTGYDALHLQLSTTNSTYTFVIRVTDSDGNYFYYSFTLPDAVNTHHVMLDIATLSGYDVTTAAVHLGIDTPPSQLAAFTVAFTHLYAVKGALRVNGLYQSGTSGSATTTTIYMHPTAITNLMMIPEKKNVPSTVQGQTIQAELKTKGQIKVTAGLIEYDAKEG